MGPFSLPLGFIGSPESQRMDGEGTGRGPHDRVIPTDLKSPLNRNIEVFSAMAMLLKRRSLCLLVVVSPPCQRVSKCCRTWQVMN